MAASLNDQDVTELIFHPVLSAPLANGQPRNRTGLSVVKADIEKIRGRIHVETRKGSGTRIEVRLPLTLAIIQGLQVAIADRSYIVPMNGVVEIVRTTAAQTQYVQGCPVIMLRNRILPIVWLRDYFHLPRDNTYRGYLSLLVVGHQEQRVAIAVDKLIGIQDIVVKSLGALLRRNYARQRKSGAYSGRGGHIRQASTPNSERTDTDKFGTDISGNFPRNLQLRGERS
jgi:two-component system chemotaxis sensor kinase CheA